MLHQFSRVAAIHDMSGFGRCSLTVILPVLSVMGVQACPVPTAVLSTHTGGFGEVSCRDLTDFISPCLRHWRQIGIAFDCIYSGFLCSERQIHNVTEFFEAYPNALKVVDPVMGDHGKAYKTISPEIRAEMASLVAQADIITPNLTEACMLLGTAYPSEPISRHTAKSWLARLSEIGPDTVVITGVPLAEGRIFNLGYDKRHNSYWCVACDYVPVSYPGTGDIYASVLVGSLLTGDSLPLAMERATRFLEVAIKTTYSYGTDPREGVMLESALPWLIGRNILCGYSSL